MCGNAFVICVNVSFGNFVEVSLTDIKEFQFFRYCKESKLAPCTVSSLELIGKFNWGNIFSKS